MQKVYNIFNHFSVINKISSLKRDFSWLLAKALRFLSKTRFFVANPDEPSLDLSILIMTS